MVLEKLLAEATEQIHNELGFGGQRQSASNPSVGRAQGKSLWWP